MRRLLPIGLNPRLLLYVSAAGASCALYRHGSLGEVQSLPPGEEGWEALNALLLQRPGLPVAIAVDTVDELYRQDQLPRARGADRREMTQRRLRQLIHHAPYRAALRQGPTTPDGRLERYLMMGLANPAMIRPWVDIIHVRGAHLVGVWLLPALAMPLVKHYQLKHTRLLLVSEQTGGLRLTYLENGELRFSRLAPVDSTSYANPLESYAAEIERTRQALVGQRLLERSELLGTVLLDPLNTLNGLHAFLPESGGFKCQSINRPQLLDTLKLPPSLLAESADALYLRLLLEAPDSANLMTPAQREETSLHWWRRGLRFVALTWLSLATLACLGLLFDAWRLSREAESTRAQAQRLIQREAATLAPAGGAAKVTRQLTALQAWQMVQQRAASPAPGFQAAVAAADAVGDIRLGRLTWEAPTPALPGSLSIAGEITGFEGDFDDAQRRIEALRQRLEAALPAGQTVFIRQHPLDPGPDQSLEGVFGRGPLTAPFRLEANTRP